MRKPRILIQLDSDRHASSFDGVVAADSAIDHILQYHDVRPDDVRDLVYGAVFTRGQADLKSTAIFVGGTDVSAGEELLRQVTSTFFGPMRVSVMLDANGANTTASAAVVVARRHVELSGVQALVLGGTGPVGQRVARLLAGEGAHVRVGSRKQSRAEQTCEAIGLAVDGSRLSSWGISCAEELDAALVDTQVVISAGALGIQLLSADARRRCDTLRVAIDLNAVPPLGLEGLDVSDTASERDGAFCYGAIGVGGSKMKIHKAALARLFEDNSQLLDAEAVYQIGCALDGATTDRSQRRS